MSVGLDHPWPLIWLRPEKLHRLLTDDDIGGLLSKAILGQIQTVKIDPLGDDNQCRPVVAQLADKLQPQLLPLEPVPSQQTADHFPEQEVPFGLSELAESYTGFCQLPPSRMVPVDHVLIDNDSISRR